MKHFLLWCAFIVALTGVSGLAYAAVQHDLRTSADYPQTHIAADAAQALAGGADPLAVSAFYVTSYSPIDIAKSLDPYIVIFDHAGTPVASSARLAGRMPSLPAGVFSYTAAHGEDRITWQPSPDVRQAIVVSSYTDPNTGKASYVMSGRSLREVEQTESDIGLLSCGIWALSAALVTIALVLCAACERRKEARRLHVHHVADHGGRPRV